MKSINRTHLTIILSLITWPTMFLIVTQQTKQVLHDMEAVAGPLESYELTDWGTQMVSDGDEILVVVQLPFATQ